MAVSYLPAGYHTVSPYLTVADARAQLEFLRAAFGAEPVHTMTDDEGRVRHAEVRVGDSIVMVGQARGEWQPTHASFYVYVPDADATYRDALAAGASSVAEPTTQFYGDRHGAVRDLHGNAWWIATHVEDVAPDEMQRREREMMNKQPA